MAPLVSIQGFLTVAQKVTEGAGRDVAERAFDVHNLFPSCQVVGAGQAVC